jgi:hypothetical protein
VCLRCRYTKRNLRTHEGLSPSGSLSFSSCQPCSWSYCVVFYGLGESRLPSRYWHIPGKVFCILPVYNEELLRLIEGVDSLLKSQYSGVLECHIAFDSDEDSDLSRGFISWFVENGARNSVEGYKGAPNTVSFFFRGGNVFVHRWPHGGKRLTQAKLCYSFDSTILLTIHGTHMHSGWTPIMS